MNNSFFAISTALCIADELKLAVDKMIENSTWEDLEFVRTEFAHCGFGVRIKFVYRKMSARGPYEVVGGHSVTPALRRIEDSDAGIVKANVKFSEEFAELMGAEAKEAEDKNRGRMYNMLTVCVDFSDEASETAAKRKRIGSVAADESSEK